ncbi:DUF1206 domain-containing protein [Pelagicoccus sp. SDUM812005]|uniref:DUF1206 domain-containing protein n=1 Tax=Pelagicoccus sp. SDUM812005 TaxID=3041257 RepID=UPI00280DD2D5|nr:DUF1206 domain-containing protein [Pelagicoccus sp. SDUM812005]MDQ8183253.1 DUF1206 domain-containing protein [Pelagicoccus sp. SDUM812005]
MSNSSQTNSAPTWLVALAKAGYGARGLLYTLIGGLAFLEAVGQGGEKTDSKGAIQNILQAPGGVAILWIMAASLVGYSTWRLVQSVLDADQHGLDLKGVLVRGGLFVSAVTHLFLAYTTVKVALNLGSSGGKSKESIVATLLGLPGGPWIVGVLGCCIAGAGIAHWIKAYKEQYKKHFDLDSEKMATLNPICRFGLFARGFAFLTIAGMFVYAAATQDPDKAGGLKEVFSTLSQQAFGPYLLGAMGIGLIAFGAYSGIESLYRKIDYK